MKNSELLMLEMYLKNWIDRCNDKLDSFAALSKDIQFYFNDKKKNADLYEETELNLEMLKLSSDLLQKVSDVATVKSRVIKMRELVNAKIENQEIELTNFLSVSLIKPYVYEKLMQQFLELLAENEMYEECALITSTLYFERDAA
jgi:hypothetical protein